MSQTAENQAPGLDSPRRRLRNFLLGLLVAVGLLILADQAVGRWVDATPHPGRLVGPHPVRLWAMRPGRRQVGHGTWVTVNSLGLRGGEQVPREDALRVLLLGDSLLFGLELQDEEAPGARLEETLARQSSQPVQVFNAAVPGYSTVQARCQLEELLPVLRPQVVVMSFLLSNDSTPSPMADERRVPPRWLVPLRLALWSTNLGRLGLRRSMPLATDPVSEPFPHVDQAGQLPDLPMRVSEEAFQRNLEDIVRSSRRSGVRQVLFLRVPWNAFEPREEYAQLRIFRSVARVMGADMVDLGRTWGRSEGVRNFQEDRGHLNAHGARVVAEALARPILQRAAQAAGAKAAKSPPGQR